MFVTRVVFYAKMIFDIDDKKKWVSIANKIKGSLLMMHTTVCNFNAFRVGLRSFYEVRRKLMQIFKELK